MPDDLLHHQLPDLYLLVVAHPDDESMFFSPTICTLLRQERSVPLRILCLSNGNYDGLGKIREEELQQAAEVLGVNVNTTALPRGTMSTPGNGGHVTCLDVKGLQDGPMEEWEEGDVVDSIWNHLGTYCSLNITKKKSLNVAVITFDARGVSGHPNHIAVCTGVRHLISTNRRRSIHGVDISICAWELSSIINPFTKYFPFLELIPMLVTYILSALFSVSKSCKSSADISFGKDGLRKGRNLLFAEDPTSFGNEDTSWKCRMFRPTLIWNAMAAHKSQFVWYRRLSVLSSRFSYCNTLRLSVAHSSHPYESTKKAQ